MVIVNILVRELGTLKPDFSLDFELPEVPSVGSYISIERPDTEPHCQDIIVRKVWWRLSHPETAGATSAPKLGSPREIVVECEVATGPYSTDKWLKMAEAARASGINVEKFEISRFSVRQSDIEELRQSGNDRPNTRNSE